MQAKASDAAQGEGLVEDSPGAISVTDNFRAPALTVAPAGPPGAHGAVQDAVHPHQEPADAEAE